MKLNELIYLTDQHKIDARGPGSTPYGIDISYFGDTVLMKPSMFLKLASPLQDGQSVEFFRRMIQNGEGFAAPMLYISVPGEWRSGHFITNPLPHIQGHEGRNRMTAILQEDGDIPVEVHILPRSDSIEWRARHITPDILTHMNKGCMNERGQSWIPGPLWM